MYNEKELKPFWDWMCKKGYAEKVKYFNMNNVRYVYMVIGECDDVSVLPTMQMVNGYMEHYLYERYQIFVPNEYSEDVDGFVERRFEALKNKIAKR